MKSRSAKPVRCAIYTRVSTDQGLEQDFNSLDAQYDASQAFIRSQSRSRPPSHRKSQDRSERTHCAISSGAQKSRLSVPSRLARNREKADLRKQGAAVLGWRARSKACRTSAYYVSGEIAALQLLSAE
jgi:hypothetical protein